MKTHPKKMAALLVVIMAAVGCRSTKPARSPEPVERRDLAAQITALSNDISRLSARLDAMEREREELRGSTQFIQTLMDEVLYEPVVSEELIGSSDGDTE